MARSVMSNGVCCFFARGFCRNGDRCSYLHINDDSRPRHERRVCTYFQQGRCRFGAQCRFEHSSPVDEVSQPDCDHHDHSHGCMSFRESSDNSRHLNLAVASQSSNSTSKTTFTSNILKDNCNGLGEGRIGSAPPALPLAKKRRLCEYAARGSCRFSAAQCSYLHGLKCDICGHLALHPDDPDQQRHHREECDSAVAIAAVRAEQSKDKQCSICMDTILEKVQARERKFAILPNCNHIFCVACLSKWRKTRSISLDGTAMNEEVIRGCPECRVVSEFFAPCGHWLEEKVEKEAFISNYKKFLSTRHCKFFRQGYCPSSDACLYRHDPSIQRRLGGQRGAAGAYHEVAADWLDVDEYSDGDDPAGLGISFDDFFDNPFVFSDYHLGFDDYFDFYETFDYSDGSSDDEYPF